jgi:excisionase family DNA binding protein
MNGVDVEDRLLSPEEVAEMLGVPVGTLANWRYQGRGPAFVKIGRHVRYRRSDVAGLVEECMVPAGRQ